MSENSAVKEDTRTASSPVAATPGHLVPESIAPAIEAILLSLDKPISASKLAVALGLSSADEGSQGEPANPPRKGKGAKPAGPNGTDVVSAAVEDLNAVYESTGRSFRIEKIAGGLRLMTLPTFAPILAAFHGSRSSGRLGKAAVETLSIIAYKQPITRAHLEAIRGVGCGEILRSLLERRLVTIKGRAEELGRPILYGTTKEFLDAFGLATLKDLPTAADLQGMQ